MTYLACPGRPPRRTFGSGHRTARQYHPDLNPNDKQAEAVQGDWPGFSEVIGEADKRKQYDRWGPDFEKIEQALQRPRFDRPRRGTGGSAIHLNPGQHHLHRQENRVADDDMLGGLFDQILGGMGRGNGRRSGMRANGEDYITWSVRP